MKVLILHQNFPGQFLHLAPALVAQGYEVHALVLRRNPPASWNGVVLHGYSPSRGNAAGIHPWLLDLESKVIRGEAVYSKCLEMAQSGFVPDVIVAHPGWGESLFVKDVWPNTKLGIYCEFNYSESGHDVDFDPEFATAGVGDACRLRMKNINNMLHFGLADAAVSPTRFQADTYPEPFRSKIEVLHDGIDTTRIKADPAAQFQATPSLMLTRDDEVITFANRNLEPYRGYHVFMRALPRLLKERPNAQVVLVGGDGVSYGKRAPKDTTWKSVFIDEVKPAISDSDWARVHFVGHLPHAEFGKLLQVSTVHVYLTYPFVLSWSLLEAMSTQCAIVASDTEPVREFIGHQDTGLLTPFFDTDQLVNSINQLLDDPAQRERMGLAARQLVQRLYDLKSVSLPRMLEWVHRLANYPVG